MNSNGMDKNKLKFFEKYDNISDKIYKLEVLWSQRIIQGKLHRIRKNLTRIFWVLVAFLIVFILSVLLFRIYYTS
jgi:hypothetical protein